MVFGLTNRHIWHGDAQASHIISYIFELPNLINGRHFLISKWCQLHFAENSSILYECETTYMQKKIKILFNPAINSPGNINFSKLLGYINTIALSIKNGIT